MENLKERASQSSHPEIKKELKKAEIKKYIDLLSELKTQLFNGDVVRTGSSIDIRPRAEKIGLDIDEVMKEVIQICDTQNYSVGGHMDCTRINVLPGYKETKEILLDRDHLEGLYQILRVAYGFRDDY